MQLDILTFARINQKHKLKIMKKNLRNVLVLGLGLITTIHQTDDCESQRQESLQDSEDAATQRIKWRLPHGVEMIGVFILQALSYDVMTVLWLVTNIFTNARMQM